MPDLFADTSGWANLVDRDQPYHADAKSVYHTALQEKRKVVTTNYIIAELVALTTTRKLRRCRQTIIDFVEDLKKAPHVEIVHVDRDLDKDAWQLLTKYRDKEWSLADCVSFVLMTQRGIKQALAADHDFEQAGFDPLLK